MTKIFEGETWDAPESADMFTGGHNAPFKKSYAYKAGEVTVDLHTDGMAFVQDCRTAVNFTCPANDAFTWARDKNEMRRLSA